MEIITSKDNNKIKYVRSLNNKKTRNSDRVFVVEGIKFVNESIKENVEIKFILINNIIVEKQEIINLIEILEKNHIDFYLCEESIFNSISETVNSQGILAIVHRKEYNKQEILERYNFLVMCDRIQDPGNLGTIIRTLDAFGPAGVIMNKGCVDVYNQKVVRATAGAMFRVPFIFEDDDKKTIENLKNLGFSIISTVVNSQFSFENIEDTEKICLVIGNEGQGISQDILQSSHTSITIRMSGRQESLNASIAAGICIYEISKKLR